MLYENLFLVSLVITLFIEILVLFILAKYILKIKAKNSKIFFVGFIASFSTLPYLWFVLPHFFANYYVYATVGEVVVFVFEAIVYWQLLDLKIKKAIFVSFICNLVSFLIGLIISPYFY